MGATVGRVANRISNARFKLNNQEYILPANFGIHHLHGNHCLSKVQQKTKPAYFNFLKKYQCYKGKKKKKHCK